MIWPGYDPPGQAALMAEADEAGEVVPVQQSAGDKTAEAASDQDSTVSAGGWSSRLWEKPFCPWLVFWNPPTATVGTPGSDVQYSREPNTHESSNIPQIVFGIPICFKPYSSKNRISISLFNCNIFIHIYI